MKTSDNRDEQLKAWQEEQNRKFQVAKSIEDDIVGKPLDEAIVMCQEKDLQSRVVMEDGRAYIVTHDFVPHRFNFVVEKGIVTDATFG